MTYEEFLQKKRISAVSCGFEKPKHDMCKMLFDWQKDIVYWTLRKGRAAIFADCGLGKTPMQLQWADAVSEHTGKPVLIVCPLAVADQTRREAIKFGFRPVTVCREQCHVQDGVNITNYEMLDYFDPEVFSGVVLDESSILKAYTGKTKRKIVDMFRETTYRLSCTATPSPNDLMELLNQAEFLGVMKSNEALSCWFIADQTSSGTYRLKKHAEKDFWQWVSSWAVCLEKPSDIGYPDDGYILPPLNEMTVTVDRDEAMDPMAELTETINMNATSYQKEKRKTLKNRVEKCAEIVNGSDEQFLVWCYLNEEADELKKVLKYCVEVRGSDKTEKKEQSALDFVRGDIRVLCSKASIFGWGLNFQHCNNMIFCGMDYSFESYYQAVRRMYRFGQEKEVNVWRVIGKNEKVILDTINRKKKIKDDMARSMANAMKDFQTNEIHGRKFRLDMTRQEVSFPAWVRSEETA